MGFSQVLITASQEPGLRGGTSRQERYPHGGRTSLLHRRAARPRRHEPRTRRVPTRPASL